MQRHCKNLWNAYLHNSRKNDQRRINWTTEAEDAFNGVRRAVADAVHLTHLALNAPIRLVTDASNTGMGTALEQWQEESWKPLAFFSRGFSVTQQRYSTYDRELTAVFESVKHFRHFLEGREFVIVTDHKF